MSLTYSKLVPISRALLSKKTAEPKLTDYDVVLVYEASLASNFQFLNCSKIFRLLPKCQLKSLGTPCNKARLSWDRSGMYTVGTKGISF